MTEQPTANVAVPIHPDAIEKAEREEILKLDKYEQRMKEIKAEYGEITINGIEDREGYTRAKEAARELRTLRNETEDDKLAATKKFRDAWENINKRAKFIVDGIKELEAPIKAKIDAIDEEKEAIKVRKKKEQDERLKVRTAALLKLGVVFNGAEYVLDDVVIELALVRETDEEIYQEQIYDQFYKCWLVHEEGRQEQARIAKQLQDQREADEREQQRQRDELREQQEKLQREQAELDRQKKEKDDADRKALQDRTKKRQAQLINGKLFFDIGNEVFRYGPYKIENDDVIRMNDEQWEEFAPEILKNVQALHDKNAQDEADRIREQEKQKLALEQEAEKEREKERLKQQELKEAEKLEKKKDKEKYDVVVKYLQKTPQPSMRSGWYRQKMVAIRDFIADLAESNQEE